MNDNICIEDVWRKYKVGVTAFVHSKVANTEDANDLLQEILIKVYQNLDTLHSDSSLKAWIFQIANRTIIDYYRKNRQSDLELLYEVASEQEEIDAKKTLAQCVEPFIRELPEKSQKLLLTIDLAGQSQKQYAEENQLNYSTLKSQLQRGRAELKSLFEDCCKFMYDKEGRLIDFQERNK